MLCLHENYNSEYVLQQFQAQPERLMYVTYDDIFVREVRRSHNEMNKSQKLDTFKHAMQRCVSFTSGWCGLDLDVDAIENVPASARTSCGLAALHVQL